MLGVGEDRWSFLSVRMREGEGLNEGGGGPDLSLVMGPQLFRVPIKLGALSLPPRRHKSSPPFFVEKTT